MACRWQYYLRTLVEYLANKKAKIHVRSFSAKIFIPLEIIVADTRNIIFHHRFYHQQQCFHNLRSRLTFHSLNLPSTALVPNFILTVPRVPIVVCTGPHYLQTSSSFLLSIIFIINRSGSSPKSPSMSTLAWSPFRKHPRASSPPFSSLETFPYPPSFSSW